MLALVTGATAGIGREFARQLAARGAELILVARDTTRLAQVADECRAQSGRPAHVWTADLSREADLTEVEAKVAALPSLDLLVNNAGFATTGKFHRVPAGPQGDMLRLHTLAPLRLARAALPGMVQRGAGGIITVGSILSFFTAPGSVTYAATKAFVKSFMLGLDMELQGTGVRVQALCPGFTRTELHERMDFDARQVPAFLWMPATAVVRASLSQLERGGAVVCVPGLRNKLLVAALRLLPHALMRQRARFPRRGSGQGGATPARREG